MSELTITINTDGAAFEGHDRGPELARILRKIGQRLNNGGTEGVALDTNGNTCGRWEVRA